TTHRAAGCSSRRTAIALIDAPGALAECRAIAHRVAALLARGTCPERIGVVARDLAPYVAPLRQSFEQLGIPFSGMAAEAPPGRAAWFRNAILEVLRRGADASLDDYLEAWSGSSDWSERADLRNTLARLRLGSLRELAASSTP